MWMAAQLFGLSYMLHMYQYFLMLTKFFKFPILNIWTSLETFLNDLFSYFIAFFHSGTQPVLFYHFKS